MMLPLRCLLGGHNLPDDETLQYSNTPWDEREWQCRRCGRWFRRHSGLLRVHGNPWTEIKPPPDATACNLRLCHWASRPRAGAAEADEIPVERGAP